MTGSKMFGTRVVDLVVMMNSYVAIAIRKTAIVHKSAKSLCAFLSSLEYILK